MIAVISIISFVMSACALFVSIRFVLDEEVSNRIMDMSDRIDQIELDMNDIDMKFDTEKNINEHAHGVLAVAIQDAANPKIRETFDSL